MLTHTRFKFCPQCAGESLRQQCPKSLICTGCGFVYYHNTAAAAGVIIKYENRIALVVRNHEPKKGLLDVPGGFVDYNESLEQTVQREVREELGLWIQNLQYYGSAPNEYFYNQIRYFTTDVFFTTTIDTLDDLRCNDEIERVMFLHPDEIDLREMAFSSLQTIFGRYLTRD